jgi:hypothetical protein
MSLYFDDFIQSVYDEIGEQAGYSQEYLANWFAGNSNLGRLNVLIDTSYSGSYTTGNYGEILSYDIEPDLGQQEMAIYKKIFEIDYFNKQARYSLSGVGILANGGSDWISLREGDSAITRTNRNEVAKTFKSMSSDSRAELNQMVDSYLKFKAKPEQVVGDDTVAGGYYRGISADYSDYRSDRDYIY